MSILAYLPVQAELDAETEREAPPEPPQIICVYYVPEWTESEMRIEEDYALWRNDPEAWERKHNTEEEPIAGHGD